MTKTKLLSSEDMVRAAALPYLANSKVQGVVLAVLFMALFGAVTFFVIGVTLESQTTSSLSLGEQIQQNWWDIVQTLMLIITSVGPIYFASVQEQRRRQQMGDFSNRVLVTLNSVRFVEGKPKLFMRSLSESAFAAVFADDLIQELVLESKKKNRSNRVMYPLMTVAHKYADWKRLRDHIKNKLSSIYTPGYIMQDVGADTIEQEYTWALTHEESGHRDDFNDKFRILVIRTDLLMRIGDKDFDEYQVGPLEQVYDKNQSLYFKQRWNALRQMHKYRLVARDQRIMMETIKFTVPGRAGGDPDWMAWEATASPTSLDEVHPIAIEDVNIDVKE